MTAAVIILSIALAAAAALLVLQRREYRSISRQLDELRDEDTNLLLRSKNGMADGLIDRINLLLREMRAAKALYNRKNHALEQMMTNISHDLRTPLTSALGYIDLMQRSDLSEEEKARELGIIEKRLQRLEELINSFFELSKVISGGKEPEKTDLDLVAVLEEAMAGSFDDWCDRGRQIVFNCSQRRLMLPSDRNMLLRIFDNLIGNALKHGAGDLTVTAEQREGISITFSNRLLSPDLDPERIFDEFYTTDISRTKGNTGLGLAIAKQFTELLGGTVRADVREGIFALTLSFPQASVPT